MKFTGPFNRLVTIALIVAGVGLGLILVVGLLLPQDKPVTPTPQGALPSKAQATGDKAGAGQQLQVTLVDWYTNAGDGKYQPTRGNQLVIVNVLMRHDLPDRTPFNAEQESYLQTNDGKTYPWVPAKVDDPLEAKTYKPGEAIEGRAAYELPLTVGEAQWCYKLANATPVCQPLN